MVYPLNYTTCWIKKGYYFSSLNISCNLRFLERFLRSTEGGLELDLVGGVFILNLDVCRLKDTVTLLTNSLILEMINIIKYYAMVGFRTAMANLFF